MNDSVGGQDRRFFSVEQIEQMEVFLETVIDAALAAATRVPAGTARDYADEVNDMLIDARIDLRDVKAMAHQKMQEQADRREARSRGMERESDGA